MQRSLLNYFSKTPASSGKKPTGTPAVTERTPLTEIHPQAVQTPCKNTTDGVLETEVAKADALAQGSLNSDACDTEMNGLAVKRARDQDAPVPSAPLSNKTSNDGELAAAVLNKKRKNCIAVSSEDEDSDNDATVGSVEVVTVAADDMKPPSAEIGSASSSNKGGQVLKKRLQKAKVDDSFEPSDVSSSESETETYKTPAAKHSRPRAPPSTSKSSKVNASPLLLVGEDRKKARSEKFNVKNEAKYLFLKDIRDANGRRPGEAEYDPRTLYIPSQFWKEATPFEKQYWQIKSQHFDTVVFFKKGKFYEMFERDADLGNREFELKLTDRGYMRMVGVPESQFEFWAAKFVAKGYKVAKVEQLESALAKEMREKDGKKEDCVRRELTAILTSGTLVDGSMLSSDMSTFCLAVKECVLEHHQGVAFGICFVDTATGAFHLSYLEDDNDRSLLETLLIQIKPKEILFEKGELSAKSQRVMKNALPNIKALIWNPLNPGLEFWGAETAVFEIKHGKYYSPSVDDDNTNWPPVLKQFESNDPVISAFGAMLWYLRSLKLDTTLVSQRNISVYDPVRQSGTLILDGQTLANLEVFQNTFDGGERGTLHSLLNRCTTPFGKRLFKQWLCHPLRSSESINERLDAIDDFLSIPDTFDAFSASLKGLPDLERLISRIHAGSCKLKDYLVVLDGFKQLTLAVDHLRESCKGFKSKRLIHILQNLYPTDMIKNRLNEVLQKFDIAKAKTENKFVVNVGAEPDFDECVAKIKSLEKEFASFLAEQKRELGLPEIKYKDIGKEIYQIEVPARYVSKVPRDWIKRSGTKALSRYHPSALLPLIRKYQEAVESKTILLDSLYARMLARFDSFYSDCWKVAVQVAAEMDCLLSLARVSGPNGVLGDIKCRPIFVDQCEQSFIDLQECRHPCMNNVHRDFIPNDIQLGGDRPNMIVLSGPNMGGKSTLLRQTCVAIIIAQLGCYVPAAYCRLAPFDRIFTRIGANDNILAGQSTFMVELSETSKILRQATPRSMVILDELGRGTATFDGYAIAYSVLHFLAQRVRCCGLFSTHYGLLTSECAAPICPTPNIRMMCMTCQVDDTCRDVTFLYKLADGVSPKSFGMNVATMAGVSKDVVDRAEKKADDMLQEKGWIGCVGLRSTTDTNLKLKSQSLMVQHDFVRLLSLIKKPEIVRRPELMDLWRAARLRYLNEGVEARC